MTVRTHPPVFDDTVGFQCPDFQPHPFRMILQALREGMNPVAVQLDSDDQADQIAA